MNSKMTLDLAHLIISILGLIAWTYFLFDRKNITDRLNKHSSKIDEHEKEIIKTKASISSNGESDKLRGEADKLRLELVYKSLESVERMCEEIKKDGYRKDNDIRDLNKLIRDYLLPGKQS